MPWLLIGLGLAIAGYGIYVRTDLHTVSQVCAERPVSGLAHVAKSGKPVAGCPAKAPGLAPAKLTTTKGSISDTVFGVLLGAGAALILGGAFYSRVSKITIAGTTFEMGDTGRDAVLVAAAVREQAKAEIKALLADPSAAADPERLSDAVVRTATATTIAQEGARELRLFASGSIHRAPLSLEPEKLQDLRRGNPLPADVLERLAKNAVKEAFEDKKG